MLSEESGFLGRSVARKGKMMIRYQDGILSRSAAWSCLALGAALLAVTVPVHAAAPFNTGDVFAGVGAGQVKHFSPTGTLLDTLNSTTASNECTGMAFDANGNLHATMFSANTISKFDSSGNLLVANFGSGYNADPESIVRDTAGNFYVGQADGGHAIMKLDSSGNTLATYAAATDARGTDWIDLASDQCTIYYTSEGTKVKRFDVCTNAQLADFATGLPGPLFALRILGDGGVLVAASTQVLHLNNTGTVIANYTGAAGTLFALNLDPDGQSFWTGDLSGGNVYKFAISPVGPPLLTFNAGILGGSMAGLAVFGEITQGGGGGAAPPKEVPALDGRLLVVLAAILAGAGTLLVRRLR